MNILVTGATSGIGLALAEFYLAEQVHTVIAIGRNEEALSRLSNQGALTFSCDLTDKEAVLSLASPISEHIEKLDLVILNAGGCIYFERQDLQLQQSRLTGCQDTPDSSNTLSAVTQVSIQQNFLSLVYSTELVLPLLLKSGSAKLAFMGSLASDFPFTKAQGYGASKAAIAYFAKSMQLDYPEIGMHLIQPGFVKTPLTDKNKFNMPFLISQEQAVQAIVKGLGKGKFIIRFPFVFSLLLKLLSALPVALQLNLARHMK